LKFKARLYNTAEALGAANETIDALRVEAGDYEAKIDDVRALIPPIEVKPVEIEG
jgi:hypothetical protein